MTFNVNEFQAALKFGGARPSLFQVSLTNPVNGESDVLAPFMMKGASIPPSTLNPIEQFYFGRTIKLAGTRTFPEWTVTVINDEDFAVRNTLEEWSNAINTHEGNIRDFGTGSPLNYKSGAQITQFGKTGEALRVYDFVGLWPGEVGEIELNWENGDQIEEFTVTFQYDYWQISGGSTGTAGTS